MTELLRVPEVADRLTLSTRQVYYLIAAGKLRVLKFGRSTRITSTEVEAFIAATAKRAA